MAENPIQVASVLDVLHDVLNRPWTSWARGYGGDIDPEHPETGNPLSWWAFHHFEGTITPDLDPLCESLLDEGIRPATLEVLWFINDDAKTAEDLVYRMRSVMYTATLIAINSRFFGARAQPAVRGAIALDLKPSHLVTEYALIEFTDQDNSKLDARYGVYLMGPDGEPWQPEQPGKRARSKSSAKRSSRM